MYISALILKYVAVLNLKPFLKIHVSVCKCKWVRGHETYKEETASDLIISDVFASKSVVLH